MEPTRHKPCAAHPQRQVVCEELLEMSKVLAMFNLIASAASLVGLAYAVQLGSANIVMVVTFGVALLLAIYVLLVPGNPLERNTAAKLELFRNERTGDEVMVQRGIFAIHEGGPATVQFFQPFAEPPKVEVLYAGRNKGRLPHVSNVTTVHVEFSRLGWGGDDQNTFAWVATGKPLEPRREA